MSSTTTSVLSTAAITGVLAHLATVPLTLDFRVWEILKSYSFFLLCVFTYSVFNAFNSASSASTTYARYSTTNTTAGNTISTHPSSLEIWISTLYTILLKVPFTALAVTVLVAGAFNVGFVGSMVVYRAVFHRLSLKGFPGPWQAKVSRFYAVWVTKSSDWQFFLRLQAWHEKYGDVVRTGPRDLSIRRASAVQAIYSPQSKCVKSNWYGEPTDKKKSLQRTRGPEFHKKRRRVWDQAFSAKALASYQPRITAKVDLLMAQLRDRKETPLNISNWMMFFSFDVMGEIGFGKDFNMLETGKENEATVSVHKNLKAFGLLHHVIWLPEFLITVPGLVTPTTKFRDWCEGQVREKQQKWDPEATPTDVISWLLKDNTTKDESTGYWQAADPVAMTEDSKLIIVAGSDTTSTALAHAVYFLIRNPQTYTKLQSIVDGLFPTGDTAWTYDGVKSVPFLDAIINETLRLKPPVPAGVHRQTPPEGIQIDELFIPGDVHVMVPTYALHRDPRYWEHPEEWWPERWLDEQDGGTAGKIVPDAFFPFSIGSYACIGKKMAIVELRSVLSRLALNFNLAFAPGVTGEDFDKNGQDTFTFAVKDLQIVLTERS